MPDLIIKPTNTSGNKVIIQVQAGGAVLTTADSGATLGNSTQDNITRLGTVTAGNLSNTAIVYPSGHIIKTGLVQAAGQSSTTTQSWNYVHDEVVLTFTPLLATSSILLHASMGIYKDAAGHGQFDFYKNASDFTETYNVTGLSFGLAFCSNLTNWSAASMQWLDPVTENSITEKTYKISLKSSDGNETYCGWGADAMCSITAWEIAV